MIDNEESSDVYKNRPMIVTGNKGIGTRVNQMFVKLISNISLISVSSIVAYNF